MELKILFLKVSADAVPQRKMKDTQAAGGGCASARGVLVALLQDRIHDVQEAPLPRLAWKG